MDKIKDFPFYPIEITKNGDIHDPGQEKALLDALAVVGDGRITDLMVVSHGWNNDMQEARELYTELFTNAALLLSGPRQLRDRKVAIAGIFWPSKKFAEDDLIPANSPVGGAASVIADAESDVVMNGGLARKLEKLMTEENDAAREPDDASDTASRALALHEATALINQLEDDPAARDRFAELVKAALPKPTEATDTADDGSLKFFDKTGDDLLSVLRAPVRQTPAAASGTGGAAMMDDDEASGGSSGGATGLGEVLSGMKAAAWRLLNFATYYQMKERAGVVGTGVQGLLKEVRAARDDLRIHLIGHSFGARVVTAAADGPADLRPSSLTLLQAAFSHNGFASQFGTPPQNGFFCNIIGQGKVQGKVHGPIVVTHTANDRAVGLAYPIASRISGDNRRAIGDENDSFGGLGRNGAVNMPDGKAVKGVLADEASAYRFVSGLIYNLEASQYIANHGDVRNPRVANVVLAAAGL